jgi:mycoredoxin
MIELYGIASCPYTAELRADLEFRNRAFLEYDVENDAAARARMIAVSGGSAVPVLVDGDRVVQIGYEGRSCYIAR